MMEALQTSKPDWDFGLIMCFSHVCFVDFPLKIISKAALKRNECLEDEMNERLRVQLEENERERKADSWRFSYKKTDQTWFSNWLFQRKADQNLMVLAKRNHTY